MVFGRSWVWFLSGTQSFSLFHACVMLISSLFTFHISQEITTHHLIHRSYLQRHHEHARLQMLVYLHHYRKTILIQLPIIYILTQRSYAHTGNKNTEITRLVCLVCAISAKLTPNPPVYLSLKVNASFASCMYIYKNAAKDKLLDNNLYL